MNLLRNGKKLCCNYAQLINFLSDIISSHPAVTNKLFRQHYRSGPNFYTVTTISSKNKFMICPKNPQCRQREVFCSLCVTTELLGLSCWIGHWFCCAAQPVSDRIPTSSQIISNWVISIPAAGPPGIYSLFVPSFFLVKISGVLCHPILSFLFYIFSSVLKSIAEEVCCCNSSSTI